MATQKKKAASKLNPVAAVLATTRAAIAAEAVSAKKPTKAPKAKPAVAAKSALAAHNEGKAALLKPKRTVSLAGTTRLSDVPDHEVYGVEELRAKLAEFPRGAIFTVSPAAPFICVFNLRGRLIGRIKDGPKQKKAKAARADKL